VPWQTRKPSGMPALSSSSSGAAPLANQGRVRLLFSEASETLYDMRFEHVTIGGIRAFCANCPSLSTLHLSLFVEQGFGLTPIPSRIDANDALLLLHEREARLTSLEIYESSSAC